MRLNLARLSMACFLVLNSLKIIAQNASGPHIDPSKPTNLYDRLSNNAEYNFLNGGKRTFGYRGNFVWASANQHQSLQLEVPVLYATSSLKLGLSDFRFRYYWVPYKDYRKKPGAFGFVLDSYLPTGKLSDGLGRGRWIVATGLSTAFVFGKFSTFPVVSYLYSGAIMNSKLTSAARRALNGYMIQSIFVYRINKRSYLDCTPIFMKNSYSNGGKNDFVLEGNYLYMVRANKMQVGCFMRRYCDGNNTTLRGAVRVYF